MSIPDMPDFNTMNREWEAWQVFVAEWRKVFPDLDLNDARFTPMVKAIECWGEELARLRLTQDEGVREAAAADKAAAYLAATESRA